MIQSGRLVGSVACPWRPCACHGVHRPPVPRAGQTAGQAVQEDSTMTGPSVSFAGNLTDNPELRHTESGSARSVVEVVAEELGPGLRWATATTTKATRTSSQWRRRRCHCSDIGPWCRPAAACWTGNPGPAQAHLAVQHPTLNPRGAEAGSTPKRPAEASPAAAGTRVRA
jgi:hypothetical protein